LDRIQLREAKEKITPSGQYLRCATFDGHLIGSLYAHSQVAELGAFARELVAWSPGTDSRIVEFLRSHAQAGCRVVTNYASEPLYFHTGLPQAYKVLESYCKNYFARGFKLYKLYERAAAFVGH